MHVPQRKSAGRPDVPSEPGAACSAACTNLSSGPLDHVVVWVLCGALFQRKFAFLKYVEATCQ